MFLHRIMLGSLIPQQVRLLERLWNYCGAIRKAIELRPINICREQKTRPLEVPTYILCFLSTCM